MQRIVLCAVSLLLVAFIAACGGSGSTAAVSTYDHPTKAFTPYSTSMGGAVQGHRLQLVQGEVTTLAGAAGTIGFFNYTGSATAIGTAARFNQPNDITTYDGSTFYVADYGNGAIRKITSSGVVTTMKFKDLDTGLPIGFNRPAGITTDGKYLYVSDSALHVVRVIDLYDNTAITIGSTSGVAGSVDSTVMADVRFNNPKGITTDRVNIFVADCGNQTVRWIKKIGTYNYAVYTLAGSSGAIGSTDGKPDAARFYIPSRITTDGANLYLTDFGNHTIRSIDILSGNVDTLAGTAGALDRETNGSLDGDGKAARFNQPNGITTDGSSLYVTDSYHNTIRVIDLGSPHTVTTLPLQGKSLLHFPLGLTTDGVSLFIADPFILNSNSNEYTYSNSILKVSNP